mgnify:CR=1 FL=1
MTLIGFDIADVKTTADMDAAIETLENDILTVSEVFRKRSQKVRKVESVCRMLLKKAALRKWNDQLTKLTKMLGAVEDIKMDVSDVVNGFSW